MDMIPARVGAVLADMMTEDGSLSQLLLVIMNKWLDKEKEGFSDKHLKRLIEKEVMEWAEGHRALLLGGEDVE